MGLPNSVFSFGKLCHCGNFFKSQCQGYKGVQRSFSENMHQSHHVLRKKSLKPSYLSSTFTKTKQNSKNFSTFLSGSFLLMDDHQVHLPQKFDPIFSFKKPPLLTQVRKEKKRKRKWTIFWYKRKEKKSPIFKSQKKWKLSKWFCQNHAIWTLKWYYDFIFFIFIKPFGFIFLTNKLYYFLPLTIAI